jgi:hypothetical protein
MELALSALPPHLREGATVCVLNPSKGFEVARKGTNGFNTLVAQDRRRRVKRFMASAECILMSSCQ